MSRHSVILCTSCTGGAALAGQVARMLEAEAIAGFSLHRTDCMNGCARAPTLAFRAPGKVAYLFGGVSVAHLPALAAFARLYAAAADGVIADARPLGDLRLRLIARIPPGDDG